MLLFPQTKGFPRYHGLMEYTDVFISIYKKKILNQYLIASLNFVMLFFFLSQENVSKFPMECCGVSLSVFKQISQFDGNFQYLCIYDK
jgi:hypothetical protein